MKLQKKGYLMLFVGVLLFICILSYQWFVHNKKSAHQKDKSIYSENIDCWEAYFNDSTYKVVVDSFITIYDVKTGSKLNSFDKPYEYRSMGMHSSGSHLAVLDEFGLVLHKINISGTTTLPEDYKTIDECNKDCIEFSADGKYLLLTDYSDVEVNVYSWPQLKLLDIGKCGDYRNNFGWEEKSGKLVFTYEVIGVKKYTYRMHFPVSPRRLKFSEPECIDSCEIKE
ncbi:MAG: hypothetical protein WCJ03_08155 [Bacteroidales bacterium]